MKKRLQTILAHAGVASRRRAAEIIEEGRVKVDGRLVAERGARIDPVGAVIEVDGRVIGREEKKYYFLLNKPIGVVSTVKDIHAPMKVTDFFKDVDARLYPVGRLDKDTTGALIMTNDGALANRLAHPSYEIDKEYRVTVEGPLSQGKVLRLERGIELDGKPTARCLIESIGRAKESTTFRVKLHEGRKRQIRRMFEAAGTKVTALRRVRYAGLTLKGLEEGEYRPLSRREVEGLIKLTGGADKR